MLFPNSHVHAILYFHCVFISTVDEFPQIPRIPSPCFQAWRSDYFRPFRVTHSWILFVCLSSVHTDWHLSGTMSTLRNRQVTMKIATRWRNSDEHPSSFHFELLRSRQISYCPHASQWSLLQNARLGVIKATWAYTCHAAVTILLNFLIHTPLHLLMCSHQTGGRPKHHPWWCRRQTWESFVVSQMQPPVKKLFKKKKISIPCLWICGALIPPSIEVTHPIHARQTYSK